MKLVIVLMVSILLSSCGSFDSPLEMEFKKLSAVKTADNSATAEKLYVDAENLVSSIGKVENPREGLMEKARALQQKRAREFARAAAKDVDFGAVGKVLKALRGSNLNPKQEARDAGISENKILKYRPPDVKVDPLADEVSAEWRHKQKPTPTEKEEEK